MKTPKEVLEIWLEALNLHDSQRVSELYHNDATNILVASKKSLCGKQAILEDFIHYFSAFPDSYIHVENLLADGEWGTIEWISRGTFLGKFAGMSPSGKKYTLPGCSFFHIMDGKIRLQRGYWGKFNWFEQINASLN